MAFALVGNQTSFRRDCDRITPEISDKIRSRKPDLI